MLSDLPPELLDHIIEHSPASSVGHLSQTSRSLHYHVEKEGWKTFNKTQFPSLSYPPYWRDAAHSLTTLSRNWHRRAFTAQYLEPTGDINALPSRQQLKKWKRPRGQTMGFQPAIDSYEEFIGNSWTDRREVVAWSAGAELVVRVRVRDASTKESFRTASPEDRRNQYEANGMRTNWWTYKPFSSVEGRDDITSVKIVRTGEHGDGSKSTSRNDQIIIGTANGDLQLLEIPGDGKSTLIQTYYVTNGLPVRSISLSTGFPQPGSRQQIAVNLSDSTIALYDVDSSKSKLAPLCELNAIPDGKRGCRIWSTKFLDSKRIAVGLGPSIEPVNVFEVRPEGINPQPVRKIGLSGDMDTLGPVKASSIYPIEPLVDANGTTGDGNIFLSGGYDGAVRLHDLRSSSPFVSMYRDPTDDAAIYSLLSRGRDRIVAGTSRHSLLKMFDLRVSGGSQYKWVDLSNTNHADTSGGATGDWNLFINPRDRYANESWRGPNSWMRRSAEGSVYSLSSPSPTSPFIFVGVENAVVEFNFSSVLDKHPDPIFTAGQDINTTQGAGRHKGQAKKKISYFGNKNDILNLAMYSQGTDGSKEAMKLRTQMSVDETFTQGKGLPGLDERWKDN